MREYSGPQEPEEFDGCVELLIHQADTPPADMRTVLLSDGHEMYLGYYNHGWGGWSYFSTEGVRPIDPIAWSDLPTVEDFTQDVLRAMKRRNTA
jgi:hypothetical protein